MNQQQTRYASNRVDTIVHEKESKLRADCTQPEKCLTLKERLLLVKQKKVKLVANYEGYRSDPYLSEIFDFSKYENDKIFDKDKYDKAIAPIRKKAQSIKDNIMLGDAEEALKMLQELEVM